MGAARLATAPLSQKQRPWRALALALAKLGGMGVLGAASWSSDWFVGAGYKIWLHGLVNGNSSSVGGHKMAQIVLNAGLLLLSQESYSTQTNAKTDRIVTAVFIVVVVCLHNEKEKEKKISRKSSFASTLRCSIMAM